jgi:hypothetical protein
MALLFRMKSATKYLLIQWMLGVSWIPHGFLKCYQVINQPLTQFKYLTCPLFVYAVLSHAAININKRTKRFHDYLCKEINNVHI